MASLRASLSGLTTRGRCLLAAGLALAVCSVLLGQRDLLRAAVFLLALPLAALVAVSRSRYRLTCTRSVDPARVEVGRPATVTLRLDNVSRLPSGVLLMEDALPYALGGRPRFVLDRVQPRGVREVTYPVSSETRGRYRVGPLGVRLTDPFGLCELARSFSNSDELVVTPVVQRLPAVRLGGDWSGGGGESPSRAMAVSGTDDAATREYRYGDDLRKVHWKSTARTGELMVRREEQPFQDRATLLLDGRRDAHRGDGPASSFEWAVSATASIGVTLARSGFVLSLLHEDGRSGAPPGVALTEDLLLDRLATVRSSDARTLDAAVQVLRGPHAAGVLVAVLGALDVEQAERVARLRTGGAVCVAVVVDSDSFAPGPPRARALAVEQAEAVTTLLVASGWRVVPARHGTDLAAVWPLAGGRLVAAPPSPATAARSAGTPISDAALLGTRAPLGSGGRP